MIKLDQYLSDYIIIGSLLLIMINMPVFAQNQPAINDTLNSFDIGSDKQITFRIYAPEADSVSLHRGDIPQSKVDGEMEINKKGIWTTTTKPLEPGAYRYRFVVDGLSVLDPCNPATSESNMNSWSLFYVSGSEEMDTKDVPHGMVAELPYYSKTLKSFRRMHVYTPPGYESGNDKFPIFYLLHGAWDSDDAWTTVGRAGFIFDNLIAQNKIEPMVVIMPDGHTGPFYAGKKFNMDEFVNDFNNEIMPLAESRYRIKGNRENRAIAGLSMGGAQTLNIIINNLDKFGYIGVFSSGIFGITGDRRFTDQDGPSWEERHLKTLTSDAKNGIELFWFGIGKDDFLLETSDATVKMLEKHDFDIVYKKTAGGHTWLNWRDYLIEFSQLLYR